MSELTGTPYFKKKKKDDSQYSLMIKDLLWQVEKVALWEGCSRENFHGIWVPTNFIPFSPSWSQVATHKAKASLMQPKPYWDCTLFVHVGFVVLGCQKLDVIRLDELLIIVKLKFGEGLKAKQSTINFCNCNHEPQPVDCWSRQT